MENDSKSASDEKKTVLQSHLNRSINIPIQQISLPKPPPLLESKRQKDEIKKDSVEQKKTEKRVLDNHKEATTGISIQKAIIQYPLFTDKVIDYYRQASQPLIQLFLDSLKLQQDHINAFQPQWIDHMKTNVENYLAFQNKMIILYIQNYNLIFKNIFDPLIKVQEKDITMR